ncbi:MAG TPA: CPBP family intramembrane glutamic endopeptidase [Candidatus Nitrosocosmicus sp.]|nr:CPBP family intramembrane glutamic endopeptidase [Candidatus Nitrosocosmicus sp.]
MKKNVSLTQSALNVWAIALFVWSIYRYKFSFPIWFDEFLFKPLLFIGLSYFYITKIEKSEFFSSIWINKRNLFRDLLLGIGIGLLFILAAAFSSYLKNNELGPMIPKNIPSIMYPFLLALATGISEEVLSRGLVLKRLYEESKNMITSSLTASILFFILHIPILFTMKSVHGDVLILFLITSFLLSLSNSFIFLSRKSLILPILINAFYNFAILMYV